jgi:large subunit ribosomal protein L3
MIAGLVLRKVGMSTIFDNEGNPIPVTILKLSGGFIVGYKEVISKGKKEKRAIVAFDECKIKNVPKPILGIIKKAGIEKGFKTLKEFPIFTDNQENLPPVGSKVGVEIFHVGDIVDITGTSKGRGFQGVVKRWGFAGGPASHGSMSHRRPGSIGQKTEPGRVWKGKKMPGHMGMQTVTVKNLKVVYVDKENEIIAVKGSVPGWIGGKVIVKKRKIEIIK